jgi:hypothetical protein
MSQHIVSLRTYLNQPGGPPPVRVALLAAGIADQLAAGHAHGRSWGTLDPDTVRVDVRGPRPNPVLPPPAQGSTPETDIRALGQLLTGTPVTECLSGNGSAADLARRLRRCARDLLLANDFAGVSAAPVTEPPPAYLPGPPPRAQATHRKRRGGVLIAASTAAAVVLAAVGITFALTRQGFPLPTRTAASAAGPRVTTTQATAPPATQQQPTGEPPPRQAPPAQPGPPPQRAPARTTITAAPKNTAPAQASVATCTPDGCAGKATFVTEGEHLYVCDNKSDGHSAVAEYQRTDVPGQNNQAWNHDGTGTCVDHNMNMPEGATITFRVCLGDFDTRKVMSCGSTVTARA